MAANMPQMGPNGQMMMLPQQQHPQPPQQPNKQLNQLVYSSLMQTMHLAPMNSWQSSVSIQDRFAKAVTLVSNTILAYPQNQSEWQKLCHSALEFEKKAFVQSPDKQSYDHAMQSRIQELVKRRQNLVPDLQNQLNTDAARQAQLQAVQQRQQHQQQIMMNQMATARGLGQQPPHGFQSLQSPMQVPAMAQQPQQIGMGMAPPGMLQNRPEQHQFAMQMGQARQPPFVPPGPGQLSAHDKARVNELALQSMNRTPEDVKANIRNMMRQKMSPAQLADAAANGRDIALIWFHNYAMNQLQKNPQQRGMMQARPGGMPPNMMAPAPHHGGQMNPALINTIAPPTVMPDGQMFVPNMESIRNDQELGYLAQQAGQVVVPASTAPGRNAAPGVMTGLGPQQMPGNQQGPNQTPRPPQGQQPFGMPPVKMDAAAQAQPGVRPSAGRPMQGQQPGMAAPNAMPKNSQSPAMLGTTLNPQFSHQNNARPPSLPGNLNNPAIQGMPPNLTPEARPGIGALPASGSTRELINEWREQQRAANNGFPGAKQGLAAGQGVMPPGARPPAMQQQITGEGDDIMAIIQTPPGRASMNSMDVPPFLLNRLRQVVGVVPAEIRKWGQLRQFIANNPSINTPQTNNYLNQCQVTQFKQLWERKRGAAAPSAPAPQQQQPPNQPMALPPGAQYPPNIAQITPNDIQNVRQRNPTLQAMPDETVIEIARKLKRDSFARKAWEMYRQSSQAQVPGVPKPTAPVSQTPVTQHTLATAATHPNPPHVVPHQTALPKPLGAPVAEAAAVPASGALKNGRAPPNPSPVTASKNLKRSNPDGAGDMPGQPANAAPRAAPQSDQRAPPAGAPKPSAEQLMKMRGRPGPSGNGDEAAAVARLRLLHGEVAQLAQQEEKQEVIIQMSPTEMHETRQKILKAAEKINLFRGSSLPLWYHLTKDDSRAKMFFKTVRTKLFPFSDKLKLYSYFVQQRKVLRQFVDQKTMRGFRPGLTISKDELDQFINMMDSMLRDLEALKKGNQETPAAEPQIPQIERPVPDLVLPPARKKPKTGASHASPPTTQQQGAVSSSPQVKAPSPVVTRKAEPPKQLPPKLTCPEPGCEMGSMGFPSEEALNAHRQEEHVKPFENPYGFLQEQMAAALGLDAQGNPKPPLNPNGQQGSTPAAPPMSATRSKQGQTPKMGSTPMSRAVSMQRQGSSAAGGKAAENSGTPNTAFKVGQTTTRQPVVKNEMGTPHAPVVEDAWSGSTVDPQNLFQSVARSLESVTGSFVPEFGTYRSLTPNDTPESSKDSGASEPSSDIPEGTSLDIDVAWQSALDSDLLWDMNNINMETFEDVNAGMFANEEYESLMFSLDCMDDDLSKSLNQ
ncbi:uncharacterized protein B0T15DRAFT_286712 [Chaetomium strumarium]|uniref:Mediator complex subunit 15 KIX domain-containing protein n=1 Tax=Chaetomium strumarium TaxID=1170767 RepID=A0AAJ0GL61_9PEZI|nr:hypothetical protein B0T15DRAFT_286712 [Chaetomium strumarium]